MPATRRNRLATAHAVVMFLALVALGILAYTWPVEHNAPASAWLATSALCLQTAVLLYLASTAALQLQMAQMLRRADRGVTNPGLPALLGHLWVLLVALATAWRGAHSRTLMARMEWQVTSLICISLLALTLLIIPLKEDSSIDVAASERRQAKGLGLLHLAICLLLIAALWFMETRVSGNIE